MMIRDKIIRCTCPALLIMLALLLGCADKAEAQITVPNPVSIHDILSIAQITDLKSKDTVKTIKKEKRDATRAVRASAVYWNPAAKTAAQNTLMALVENKVGLGETTTPTGIKGVIMSFSGMENQKIKFSSPDDPNGLAVRFAPSDAELGAQ